MNLHEYNSKNISIVLKSGKTLSGLAYDFTSALDNEPQPASITIGLTEIFETEIESIIEL